MAVLSFSHLKKSPVQEAPKTAPESIQRPVVIGGVTRAIIQDTTAQTVNAPTRLQRPRGIGIMKTALLASVNYCDGCPRFWPADEKEKAQGVHYGRCCRSGFEKWQETWKIIPLSAKVSRCWFHINQPDSTRESKTKVLDCLCGKSIPMEASL